MIPLTDKYFSINSKQALNGEQQKCRNKLLDKVSKIVLGHFAEKIFLNLKYSKKCRFSFLALKYANTYKLLIFTQLYTHL
jgi:hypothetical protein